MTHRPISRDPRYTVTLEHTGKAQAQWVVRFCGDWIDCRSTRGAAIMRAIGYHAQRMGALCFTEISA